MSNFVYWVKIVNKNSKTQIPNSKIFRKIKMLGFGILTIGILISKLFKRMFIIKGIVFTL